MNPSPALTIICVGFRIPLFTLPINTDRVLLSIPICEHNKFESNPSMFSSSILSKFCAFSLLDLSDAAIIAGIFSSEGFMRECAFGFAFVSVGRGWEGISVC